ncbi:MAG: AAA family ATPase [Candidatus Omnitrophota bacterium]|nr:AAA family ATPase [Candidatus Omnitrophota bacterium]
MQNTIFTRYKILKIIIVFTVITAFLCQNIVWADGHNSINMNILRSGPDVLSHDEFNFDRFNLPGNLGTIQDSWFSSPRHKTRSGASNTIIHIHDAHCNYYAQHKIAEIIKYFNSVYGISVVNLEGGEAEYDLSILTDVTNKGTRGRVVDSLVKEGKINGAELYAIMNPGMVNLWGVENPRLYIRNLEVYRSLSGEKRTMDELFNDLSGILNDLKFRIFNKELVEFDEQMKSFKDNRTGVKEYLEFLAGLARRRNVEFSPYPNTGLLLKVIVTEKEIDFERAQKEREQVIDALGEDLSKAELEELVVKTVQFKEGRLSQERFYRYLLHKMRCIGIELKRFPDLHKYSEYVSVYEKVDKARLFLEIESLEKDISGQLCNTPEQKKLAHLLRTYENIKDMLSIKFTKHQYDHYIKHKKDFDMRHFISFINENARRYGINTGIDAKWILLNGYIRRMEKFYRYSFRRDKAFLENIRFKAQRPGIEARKPEIKERGERAAILVTGGFHSENICKLMRERGISYVSIIPQFTCPEKYESYYFQLLNGELSREFEKIERIFGISTIAVAGICSILGEKAYGKEKSIMEKLALHMKIARAEKETDPAVSGIKVVYDGAERYFDTGWTEIDKDEIEDVQVFETVFLTDIEGSVLADKDTKEVNGDTRSGQEDTKRKKKISLENIFRPGLMSYIKQNIKKIFVYMLLISMLHSMPVFAGIGSGGSAQNTDSLEHSNFKVEQIYERVEKSPSMEERPTVSREAPGKSSSIKIAPEKFKIMRGYDDLIYLDMRAGDIPGSSFDTSKGANLFGYKLVFSFKDDLPDGTEIQIFLQDGAYKNVYSKHLYVKDGVAEFSPVTDDRDVTEFYDFSSILRIGIKVWNQETGDVLSGLKEVTLVKEDAGKQNIVEYAGKENITGKSERISPKEDGETYVPGTTHPFIKLPHEKFRMTHEHGDHIELDMGESGFTRPSCSWRSDGENLRNYKIVFVFGDDLPKRTKIQIFMEGEIFLGNSNIYSKYLSVTDGVAEFDHSVDENIDENTVDNWYLYIGNIQKIGIKVSNQKTQDVLSNIKGAYLVRKDVDSADVIGEKKGTGPSIFTYLGYFLVLIGIKSLFFIRMVRRGRGKNRETILNMLEDFEKSFQAARSGGHDLRPLLLDLEKSAGALERRGVIKKIGAGLKCFKKYAFLPIKMIRKYRKFLLWIATPVFLMAATLSLKFGFEFLDGLFLDAAVGILLINGIDALYTYIIKRYVILWINKRINIRKTGPLKSSFLRLVEKTCDYYDNHRDYYDNEELIAGILDPAFIASLVDNTEKKASVAVARLADAVGLDLLRTKEEVDQYRDILIALGRNKYSGKARVIDSRKHSAYSILAGAWGGFKEKRLLGPVLDSDLFLSFAETSGKNIHDVFYTIDVLNRENIITLYNIADVKAMLEAIVHDNKDVRNVLKGLRTAARFNRPEWNDTFIERTMGVLKCGVYSRIAKKAGRKERADYYGTLFAWAATGLINTDNINWTGLELFTPSLISGLQELIHTIVNVQKDIARAILNPSFFLEFIKNSGKNPEQAVESLRYLVMANVVNEDNLAKFGDFFAFLGKDKIAEKSIPDNGPRRTAYDCLNGMCEEVINKGIDPSVLDPDLLTGIADSSGRKVYEAFSLLQAFVHAEILNTENFYEIREIFTALGNKVFTWDDSGYMSPEKFIWNIYEEKKSGDLPVLSPYLFLAVAKNVDKAAEDVYEAFSWMNRNMDRDFSFQEIKEIIEGIHVVKLLAGDERAVGEYISFLADRRSLSFRENVKVFLEEKKNIRISGDEMLFSCQVPGNIRDNLKNQDLDGLFWEVNRQNYFKEPYAGYLYLKMKMDVPSTAGLSYEEFIDAVTKKLKRSRYLDLITGYISRNIFGEDLELTGKEQAQIMDMSVDLNDEMKALIGKAAEKPLSPITFRELVRYNVDFSKFYLWQREGARKGTATLKNVLEVFVLTAYNVYGRFIRDENMREKFIDILLKCLESHYQLVEKAQMYSPGAMEKDWRSFIREILDYADYEDLERKPADAEIPLEVKIRALINRATQVESSLMLLLGDTSMFLDEVLREMETAEDMEVVSLSMSGFTRRQELFGMYLPQEYLSEKEIHKELEEAEKTEIEEALGEVLGINKTRKDIRERYEKAGEGEKATLRKILESVENESREYIEEWRMPGSDLRTDRTLRWAVATYLRHKEKWQEFFQWQDGVLEKISGKARENSRKKYYLVFENIEACPHRVRVLLNPVLWEKTVEVPEKGETVNIPPKLNFIFTMHKDSEIDDPSFMDRHLVHYVRSAPDSDMKKYLVNKTGLSEDTAEKLIQMKTRFKDLELKKQVNLSFVDLIEIGKRIKGISMERDISETGVFAQEAYHYLYLRLRDKEDRQELEKMLSRGISGKEFQTPDIKMIGSRIFFGGVGIEMSAEFREHVSGNKGKSPEDLMLEFYGFDVSELERRVFAQLARAYRYGSKVVQLEGPSGDGKTEIGKVFSRLIGFDLREKTVNADTNRSEICGQIRATREGKYYLYQPEYTDQIREGRNVFLFNEINTNLEAALYYWLFPEITGKRRKFLPEFAATDESIAKMASINQNNLWLFTVNPKSKSFKDRGLTPPRALSHIPVFHMALETEDIPGITRKLFVKKRLDNHEKLSDHAEYEEVISDIHNAFRNARAGDRFFSNQDITRRKLMTAVDKFSEYLNKGDLSPPQALRKSIDEVYVYMWISIDDKETARGIVKKALARTILKKTEEVDAQELITSVFKKEGRPVLLFTDAVTGSSCLERAILEKYPGTRFHEIPLSFFHRKRQLLGGFIPPRRAEGTVTEKRKRVDRLSARFEMGLGIIPHFIREARLDPDTLHVMHFRDYTELNPQVAPILNEFLQTGSLSTLEDYITPDLCDELMDMVKEEWDRLRGEYQEDTGKEIPAKIDNATQDERLGFARWFYSNAPENLRIIAMGSSVQETSLTPAEIDRFQPINISEGISRKWIIDHIERKVAGGSPYQELADIRDRMIYRVDEAYKLFEEQRNSREYNHNRLGKKDIDNFLDELLRLSVAGDITDAKLDETAFYMLGAGLRPAWREKLSYNIEDPEIFEDIPGESSLAPTRNLIIQLNSMLLAFRAGRPVIFEGEPGGGKTAACEEFASMMDLPFYKECMYEDIDLGDFLGRMAKKGQDFVLTCEERDANGSFVLKFLKAYQEGGVLLLDEGAMGANAQSVIDYLTEVSQMEELDLGTFHPGLREKDRYIKRNEKFFLIVTQNPADTTDGRKPISYKTDTLSFKVWVDNILSGNDIEKIINHYLKDKKDSLPGDIKKKMIALHTQFSRIHPHREELSPRQLIKITTILKHALIAGEDEEGIQRALFTGTMVAYMSRLSGEDFARLWQLIKEELGEISERFLEEWKADIDIRRDGAVIAFDGVKIPVSFGEGNVEKEDIFLDEMLSSQNVALRQLALGVYFNEAIDLMEEDGADALDLVRKFAHLTGYELEVLWSHPHMTRMQMLYSLLPKFEKEFDKHGIKKEDVSGEFVTALGFLMRHLLTEEEYEKEKDDLHVQNILFFNMMDAIPERQRVVLNEILTTRKVSLPDANYVLPEWVHIMISSSVEHKFASAFMNRFMPIRVNSLLNFSDEDLKAVIRKRYPLIRDEEVDWIWTITDAVHRFDKHGVFDINYGYSGGRDILKMARMVQLEKQRDIENGEYYKKPFTRLYYVLKAAYIMYQMGLEGKDAAVFEKKILERWLNGITGEKYPAEIMEAIPGKIKEDIEQDLDALDTITHSIRIEAAELEGEGRILDNGIMARKTGKGILVQTPDNIYDVDEDDLGDWLELSEGFRIRKDKDSEDLLIELDLIKSVGGAAIPRSDFNLARSLPENEVSTKKFMRYTPQVKKFVSSLLRAWQRVEDSAGRTDPPRSVFIMGETGTAKTTVIRNLAEIMGVPMYTLNAYEDLKTSNFTVGLRIREGKYEVGIKEFLARCGKINGERVIVPSVVTSSKAILLIDEANASPELFWALLPIFRGERKFTIEYAGESIEVELDKEIMLAFTFNPAERYSGRGQIPREVSAYAEKLWAPDPLDSPREVLISILSEYHRRGITRIGRELADKTRKEPASFPGEYVPVESATVKAGNMTETFEGNVEESMDRELEAWAREAIESGKVKPGSDPRAGKKEPEADKVKPESGKVGPVKPDKEKTEKKPPKQGPRKKKTVVKLRYDISEIRENSEKLLRVLNGKDLRDQGDYFYFAREILKGFLIALANGAADEDLKGTVLAAADKLDRELGEKLRGIMDLYERKKISKLELKERTFDLRRVFVKRDIFIFIFLRKKEGVPYLDIFAEKIKRTLNFNEKDFVKMGIPPGLIGEYQTAGVKALFMSKKQYPDKNKGGYFEGEFAVAFEEIYSLKKVSNWAGWHELGHVMDQLRTRNERDDFRTPKNIELNSMLFPAIFSPFAREYILTDLVRVARMVGDPDDYYSQAAKGILNGFILYTGKDVPLITDKFEFRRISSAAKIIRGLTPEEINHIAAELYKNRGKYLYTTGEGFYRSRQGQEEMTMGVDGDVRMMEEDGGEEEEVDVEKNDKEKPTLEEDVTGKPGNGGKGMSEDEPAEGDDDGEKSEEKGSRERAEKDREGPGEAGKDETGRKDTKDEKEAVDGDGVSPAGWDGDEKDQVGKKREGKIVIDTPETVGAITKRLQGIAPNLVREWTEVFTEQDERTNPADEGDEIDPENMLLSLEPFLQKTLIRSRPSVDCGITVDISYSTQDRLLAVFVEMARIYSELFYSAARKNKDIDFYINAIGKDFFSLLEADKCRDKEAVEATLGRLSGMCSYPGIKTQALIEGLRKKYKNRKQKKYGIEIVFTDGVDVGFESFKVLRNKLDALEEELGMSIVFIGIGKEGRDVRHYPRYLCLGEDPGPKELMLAIMGLSLLKVQGRLPRGNLIKALDLESPDASYISKKTKLDEKEEDGGIIRDEQGGISALRIIRNLEEIKESGPKETREVALSKEELRLKELKEELSGYIRDTMDQNEDIAVGANKDEIEKREGLLAAYLSLIEHSPPEFYTYGRLVRDFFGCASVANDFICLHASVKDNKVALFHELGHLLGGKNGPDGFPLLDLRLEDDRLAVKLHGAPETVILELSEKTRAFIREGSERTWPADWRINDHYLLRVLAREMFGDKDKELSQTIRKTQYMEERLQGISASSTDIMSHVRFPGHKTIILMPKTGNTELEGKIMEGWQLVRKGLWKEYRMGNMTVRFYDADNEENVFGKTEKDIREDSDAYALVYAREEFYGQIKDGIGEIDRIYCVKEEIGRGELALTMIGTHIVLALGLIDLVRNDYGMFDENKYMLIDSISKLLFFLTEDEKTVEKFRNNWQSIFGGFTLRIRPFSEELKENIIAVEAVAKSL